MACISYYLLAQPATYSRLNEELSGLDPLRLKWTELEQKPYLWAIIHEALRLMPGVSQRLPRRAREEDLVYSSKDGQIRWTIPRNTPIGMSPQIQHHNEELFPSPKEFVAERWLDKDGRPDYALVEKSLISFGKGSRICLGRE